MTQQDQEKILEAGFTILKVDDLNNRIRAKTKDRPFFNLLPDRFLTNRACRRRVAEMLEDSKTILLER
jgi:hypothetical protein